MNRIRTAALMTLPLLVLAGCASAPGGPSVMALPGSGKSFEQFRYDDAECRDYARAQTGGRDAAAASTDAGVRSAAVGTVVGAAAGALIGGHQGAGVGAGTGLLMGSAIGTGAAQDTGLSAQRRYDNAYVQCMYAKGQQVPAYGQFSRRTMQQQAASTVAPSASYPPPPPAAASPSGSAAPATHAGGSWYYCASARKYYPYVNSCSEGWRVVPAAPPPDLR
ncbi:glycine zipper family protein [Methyloversatilis thermotolerans]|uniref:glycine zipper family protein n=1 Tax=Methyloversatilis thermotolerans TaxID=1346290 RepID=UPI00036ED0E0|nr:glycine zipper family protein [Methyloversatilis thermotolerans]